MLQTNSKDKKNHLYDIITYNDYYNRLKNLALSMFKWNNVPDTMDTRFLEKTLFEQGISAIFEREEKGMKIDVINTRCTAGNQVNLYDIPTQYNCIANNGFNKTIDTEKIVLVRNNQLELPTSCIIHSFALRLATVERIIDINLNAQKTPILIKCSEKERMSYLTLYNKYDGNSPFVFGSKNLNIDDFSVLKTDAPYLIDKLTEYKKNLWSEALTFLGINNVDEEKKERLITDEVNANNQLIAFSVRTMLMKRQEACTEANKKFGLNLSVEFDNPIEINNNLQSIKDENNGNLHN
ncbi:MAG: hypothetical protein HFG28_16255 [Eubacterium sp.]|nr:hypothetical protein [Eubacterium sp.]